MSHKYWRNNEAAAPSFTGQVRETHRITRFLNDALVLNNAQRHAVEGYTVAEREALALAAPPTNSACVRQAYLQVVNRVLADTTLSLDGPELALR